MMNLFLILLVIFPFLNCNEDPTSDHCDNIYTWEDDDNVETVASKVNVSVDDLIKYNPILGQYNLAEGEVICLTRWNVLSCGTYPTCYFSNPDKFCDTYTIDNENVNITCQEICDQFDISLYDLLDFNRHNDNF